MCGVTSRRWFSISLKTEYALKACRSLPELVRTAPIWELSEREETWEGSDRGGAGVRRVRGKHPPDVVGESHPVQGDDHGSSQADVVLQGHFGPGDLPPARLATQLPAQLSTLGQTWGGVVLFCGLFQRNPRGQEQAFQQKRARWTKSRRTGDWRPLSPSSNAICMDGTQSQRAFKPSHVLFFFQFFLTFFQNPISGD